MKKHKATNITKLNRIKQVMSMLVTGSQRWEIVDTLSREWNCSDRNVDIYINASKKLFQKHFDETTIAEMDAKYDYLFHAALSGDKDYLPNILAAKSIIDSKTKLKGIVDRVEVTHKVYKTNWGNDEKL